MAENKIVQMPASEFVEKYKPGRTQWARFGSVGDWNITPLVEAVRQGRFDPNMSLIEVCEDGEILDGNRRGAALAQVLAENPNVGKVKLRVRLHSADMTLIERQDVRTRAAKGTVGWDRADFIHAMVNCVLDCPGEASEEYMAETVGLDRILEQFPRAVKRNPDGSFARDEKGKLIWQNRQGPFQDAKRLARLPVAVREAFLRGLRGEGPVIPSRALTTLVADYEKDRLSNAAEAAAAQTASIEAIRGALGARLVTFLAGTTAPGRGAGKGAMSGKDLDMTATQFGASRFSVNLLRYCARKPGAANVDQQKRLIEAAMLLERLVTAHDPALAARYSQLMSEFEAALVPA